MNNLGFIGEYNFNIDDSHRLNIPNSFKKLLNENFVIAKGFEKCLYVFPADTWNEISEKLNTLSFTKEKNRMFNRGFTSGAFEIELDGKGRIVINAKLLDYAGIKKECTILGVGNRIEIWDSETYNKYMEENQELISSISEELDI